MADKRVLRGVLLLISLALLAGSLLCFYRREKEVCLGVELLSQEELNKSLQYTYVDFSQALRFQGEPVAVDLEQNTIYLSVSPKQDLRDLEGELKLELTGWQYGFVRDEFTDRLPQAMAQGHAYRLYLTNGSSYMTYRVVFTSLPVLSLTRQDAYKDEEGRSHLTGALCLWTPEDPEEGRYTVRTGALDWRIRGGSSSAMPKKSYKLSLKDRRGGKRNDSFLGQGKDDDWILNAMSKDDTKIREPFFMDLWNQNAEEHPVNPRMVQGSYVELVCRGQYAGVYLLMRRIDEKYLELGPQDVLFKADTYGAESARGCYQLVYSGLPEDESYSLIEAHFDRETPDYCRVMNPDNFADTTLFVQFTQAVDNGGKKNMYHLFRYSEGGYEETLLPWDTDLSFGLTFDQEIQYFKHHPEDLDVEISRREISDMRQIHGDLDDRLRQRWAGLRQGVLSEENVRAEFRMLAAQLQDSGALLRDREIWGLFSEQDTIPVLEDFIRQRLERMDRQYLNP